MRRHREAKHNHSVHDGPFICERCGSAVGPAESGTEHRNHCCRCLWSLHVDMRPGDRRSGCRGLMEPIAIWVQRNGEWALVHRCTDCGVVRTNRIAGDDSGLLLMSLAVRPLARPPFPLDALCHRQGAASQGGHPAIER